VLGARAKRSGSVSAGAFAHWLQAYREAQTQAEPTGNVPCGDCNGCCRASYFIQIHSDERETLARIAPLHLTRRAGDNEPKWTLDQSCAGACPMLVQGACSIYDARPRTCRRFDCRVFAAAGVSPGAWPRAAVNARVWQWRFELASEEDVDCQNAVLAAAAFLQRSAALIDADVAPANASELVNAAAIVYELFLESAATRDDAALAAAINHALHQRACLE
jgi:uncharacterized protein